MLAGFLATIVDEKDFPSFADGVWWAIVTVATVGYGDIVPTNARARAGQPGARPVGDLAPVYGCVLLVLGCLAKAKPAQALPSSGRVSDQITQTESAMMRSDQNG
jgi:hypothetical protein